MKAFHELLAEETLHLVRPSLLIEPYEILVADWGQHDKRAANVKKNHCEMRSRMTANMAAFTVTPELKQLSPKQLFKEAGRERCAWMLRDLKCFLENPKRSINDYEDGHLMGYLVRHGLTLDEAAELREHVRYPRWEAIPVNAYDLLIGSVWSHDLNHERRNYRPNDDIDRWRAVVALRYAHLFITDGPMADLCRRAKVSDYSDTTVVSVKERELLRDSIARL